MKRFVVGVDFGTLSARAIVLDVTTKKIVSECTSEYKHGVISDALPDGTKLPPSFALQHPRDYIDSLGQCVKGAINNANINTEDIGAIGVDFTASTVLPIYSDGTPLAFDRRFESEPHAFVKLWKHHGAQKEADDFTRVAKMRGEEWTSAFGEKVSAEFMLPKILETARCCPEVFNSADRFIEAGDWIDFILTGKETHAAAFAGYKAFWNESNGYPSNEYFKAVDPILDGIIGTKISDKISRVSERAGELSEVGAKLTGLKIGTPVSLAMLDAHATLPAHNITDCGNLMMILGTSCCHIVNSNKMTTVDGIFGRVKDGVIPDLITYEAGQQCFGDAFDWFINNATPKYVYEEAEKENKDIHKYLTEKAEKLKTGESGVLALDWFNGNRSILVNSLLSGLLVGVTINTKPEEIYRALLEAAAFGTKRIVDQFEDYGIEVNALTASGGIANKNPLLMQILSDVLNREIRVCGTTQAGALGSAIYASVAGGFYPDIKIAAKELSVSPVCIYKPVKENADKYLALYNEYLILHDYFGKSNMVMERISKIKQD